MIPVKRHSGNINSEIGSMCSSSKSYSEKITQGIKNVGGAVLIRWSEVAPNEGGS